MTDLDEVARDGTQANGAGPSTVEADGMATAPANASAFLRGKDETARGYACRIFTRVFDDDIQQARNKEARHRLAIVLFLLKHSDV